MYKSYNVSSLINITMYFRHRSVMSFGSLFSLSLSTTLIPSYINIKTKHLSTQFKIPCGLV